MIKVLQYIVYGSQNNCILNGYPALRLSGGFSRLMYTLFYIFEEIEVLVY